MRKRSVHFKPNMIFYRNKCATKIFWLRKNINWRKKNYEKVYWFSILIFVHTDLAPKVKEMLLHISLCQASSMHNALFPLHYEF